MPVKIVVVYGTRPEAIKCAPVIRALVDSPGFEVVPLFTGQHPAAVIHPITDLFGVREHVNLAVLRPGQTLNELAARTLERIDSEMRRQSPEAVLAQGDTTAVAMTAVAAYNLGIPFIHLEAGLRTGTLSEPRPEEGNRRIAGHLAALHLAPTSSARANLEQEGISPADIAVTGNTVIDALQHALDIPLGTNAAIPADVRELIESGRRLILVTAHRRENWKDLENIGKAMHTIAQEFADDTIVYCAHANPEIRRKLGTYIRSDSNIFETDPLPYHEFAHLVNASHLVLTDSGGLQEEAPSLGKPVIVMRNATERPEAAKAGTVRVVGNETSAIVANVEELLSSRSAYEAIARTTNPYGDGQATGRVIAAIKHFFGSGPRVPDFQG